MNTHTDLAYERFIDALSAHVKVKTQGHDRARAQCPAHQGADLNLSVARGDAGVLIRCWSQNCTEADIARAVGLDLRDLFDHDGRADYDYGAGHHVYRARTPQGKTIRQTGVPPVTSLWTPPGSSPIADAAVVALAEGEKSADALARMGAPCAATWSGGSNGVGKVHLEPLRGKTVVICPDNDEPGQKALAGLLYRLGDIAAEVKVWRTPAAFQGMQLNDPADLYLAGGTLNDLVADGTPTAPVDPLFETAVDDAAFQERVRREARRRVSVEMSPPARLNPITLGELLDMDTSYDWLVPDLLERGDRLVITGYEGRGKSVMMRQFAICLAGGVHPFDRSRTIQPRKVLMIDAENSSTQNSRASARTTRVVIAHGTNPRETMRIESGQRLDLTRAEDVNEVHRLIDLHHPDVLALGPLYKMAPKAINTDDDAGPLLAGLDTFRERGVTLIIEGHAGHARANGGPGALRPRGSSALLGWPEFGYGMEPQELDQPDSMMWWTPWRGDRDRRQWPRLLRQGLSGELPWEVESW